MSVWVDGHTRVVVQGMGRDGSFHARSMKEYGTQVVAGVSPTRAGESVDGIPLFANLADAVEDTGANTSIIYVPAAGAADAVYEAASVGVELIVCITEGIPVRDMLGVWAYVERVRDARGDERPRLIGPNCPGLISPGLAKVGIIPGHIHKKGPVGLVSRSGTLTYEVVDQLTRAGLGQSTCIGIGGDPIIGTTFIDTLGAFEEDPETEAIVLIGEIGGSDEDQAAAYIQAHVTKPVVTFIAGQTAPPGKRMGHAGAIISGGSGTAAEKMAAFAGVGVPVARIPSEIPGLVASALGRGRRKAGPAAGRKKKRAASKRAASKRGASKRAAARRAVPAARAVARGKPGAKAGKHRARRPARKKK